MDPDQNVQAVLDPCWSQTHYVGFVVTQLIYTFIADTWFLVKFLRIKKYSQLEARNALERYWKVRTSIPEWFANKDPRDKQIQDVIEKGYHSLYRCLIIY
jgi:hypothetical protein